MLDKAMGNLLGKKLHFDKKDTETVKDIFLDWKTIMTLDLQGISLASFL